MSDSAEIGFSSFFSGLGDAMTKIGMSNIQERKELNLERIRNEYREGNITMADKLAVARDDKNYKRDGEREEKNYTREVGRDETNHKRAELRDDKNHTRNVAENNRNYSRSHGDIETNWTRSSSGMVDGKGRPLTREEYESGKYPDAISAAEHEAKFSRKGENTEADISKLTQQYYKALSEDTSTQGWTSDQIYKKASELANGYAASQVSKGSPEAEARAEEKMLQEVSNLSPKDQKDYLAKSAQRGVPAEVIERVKANINKSTDDAWKRKMDPNGSKSTGYKPPGMRTGQPPSLSSLGGGLLERPKQQVGHDRRGAGERLPVSGIEPNWK